MHYPRRKADCLLLAKADKVSAKLYNNGKGNAFHHRNSQRIFMYAHRCGHFKTKRVLCWSTKIEECSPILHYIKGPCNILAGNLSKLHCLVTPAQIAEGKKLAEPGEVSNEEEDEAYFLDQEYSGLYDEDVCTLGLMANLKETHEVQKAC
jgi:hypothetical protein